MDNYILLEGDMQVRLADFEPDSIEIATARLALQDIA